MDKKKRKERHRNYKRIESLNKKLIGNGIAVLGTCDCGGAMMGAPASTRKTVTARDLEVVDVLNGSDGVGSRWLMGQRQVTDLWVWRLVGFHGSTSSFFLFFFFLWFVGCGFCDQRRAWMVVTGLGGVAAGFSVGLGVKISCGAWGYIRIAGAGLGLFKISWGKNLKRTIIFGWLALLMVLLSSGCLWLCCKVN